jgi:hypothetical protein
VKLRAPTVQSRVHDALKMAVREFAGAIDRELMKPPPGYHVHERHGYLADGWVYREPCEYWTCKDVSEENRMRTLRVPSFLDNSPAPVVDP